MAANETTIIPLDDAHEALSVFGIEPSHRSYQRWRRDDGFRLVDLEDVLDESQFVLKVDWREYLQDAIDIVLAQLSSIGVLANADLGEEGAQGHIEINGERKTIKYVPSDDDDFDQVIRSINSLIYAHAQYRKFRSCEGTDGWAYGLLSNEDWTALESSAADLTRLLFVEGPRLPP